MIKVDVKVVMLGDVEVGKTSLLERYINERFNESIPYQNTIGAAFAAKEVEVNEGKIVLGIWDTAGSERYKSMVNMYYRGAKAAIICYDITDRMSFIRARYWIQELRSQEENCKIYLCATKKDLLDNSINGIKPEPSPNLDIVQNYVDGIKSKFFITSSKTGENIAQLFQEIAEDYVSNTENFILISHQAVNLSVLPKDETKNHCCGWMRRP